MLSARQISLLRDLQGLRKDVSRRAWDVEVVIGVCAQYDQPPEFFYSRDGQKVMYDLLIEPKIVSLSPDGRWCKITDYGIALYHEAEAAQEGWEQSPIITLEDAEKNQIIIRPGENFRAKFLITQIFGKARTGIRIQDNYCASELLEWLYSASQQVTVRLLTSPKTLKQDKSFESLYRALNKERPSVETRITNDNHDRKVIIDNREAFQVGESIKDLGNKGTTITRLGDAHQHIAHFDALWNASKPL